MAHSLESCFFHIFVLLPLISLFEMDPKCSAEMLAGIPI
jgi:hypothetical protein